MTKSWLDRASFYRQLEDEALIYLSAVSKVVPLSSDRSSDAPLPREPLL